MRVPNHCLCNSLKLKTQEKISVCAVKTVEVSFDSFRRSTPNPTSLFPICGLFQQTSDFALRLVLARRLPLIHKHHDDGENPCWHHWSKYAQRLGARCPHSGLARAS